MKKKTLIGLAIGAMLIVAAVWINLKPQITETPASSTPTSSQSSELDSLLSYTDQSLNDVEAAIKNFDDIDENLDNEKTLAMTIDNLTLSDANPSDAKTTPPDDAAPAPKTVNINTSDLDGLLGEIDAADTAAGNSISDLDSINENEDKINI